MYVGRGDLPATGLGAVVHKYADGHQVLYVVATDMPRVPGTDSAI